MRTRTACGPANRAEEPCLREPRGSIPPERRRGRSRWLTTTLQPSPKSQSYYSQLDRRGEVPQVWVLDAAVCGGVAFEVS